MLPGQRRRDRASPTYKICCLLYVLRRMDQTAAAFGVAVTLDEITAAKIKGDANNDWVGGLSWGAFSKSQLR